MHTVCLVGLGRAGHFHYRSIQQMDNVQLKYIVDPDPEALKGLSGNTGVIHLVDIDQAIADDAVDIVIVATPTQFHFEYIRRSLEAGKHVFTEKPLGKTLEEIEKVYALAVAQKKCLHLGFQRRYDTNFEALKASLPQLGDARLIRTSSRDNPKPSLDYLKISGNIFHDMLIHDFDMLNFLFGPQLPETIYARGYAYDNAIAELRDFDTVLVTLQYENGMICSIDTSRTASYGYDQRIEIFGKDGMICTENEVEHTLKFFNDKGMQSAKALHSFPQRYKSAYFKELLNFMEAIEEGPQFNINRKECVLAHLIADAAYESAVKNEVINFKLQYGELI